MSFLHLARYGIDLVSRAFNPRIKAALESGFGILAPLPDEIVDTVERMNIFRMVHWSDYDAALSLVALRRSAAIEWSAVDLEDPLLLYTWTTGEVDPLSEKEVFDSTSDKNRKRADDGEHPRICRCLPSVTVFFRLGDQLTVDYAKLLA